MQIGGSGMDTSEIFMNDEIALGLKTDAFCFSSEAFCFFVTQLTCNKTQNRPQCFLLRDVYRHSPKGSHRQDGLWRSVKLAWSKSRLIIIQAVYISDYD